MVVTANTARILTQSGQRTYGSQARIVKKEPTMLRSATWTSALTLLLTGCTSLVEIPDQSQFEDLDTLVRRDEAFVRVYIAPARGADLFATHPWFVVKESGERLVTRWEVSHRRGGPHNHVKRNFREPEADVGAGRNVHPDGDRRG